VVTLDLRPLYSDESFDVDGKTYVFTNDRYSLLRFTYQEVILIESGWALYARYRSIYYIAAIVAGKPGHWHLYYYHQQKGLLKEGIEVPRSARYRMLQIIEESWT